MFIINGCIHFQQIGVEGMSWQTFIYDNDKMSISTFLLCFVSEMEILYTYRVCVVRITC